MNFEEILRFWSQPFAFVCKFIVASYNVIRIGTDNGYLPHGAKTLPEPIWHNLCEIWWLSPEGNLTRNAPDTLPWLRLQSFLMATN